MQPRRKGKPVSECRYSFSCTAVLDLVPYEIGIFIRLVFVIIDELIVGGVRLFILAHGLACAI